MDQRLKGIRGRRFLAVAAVMLAAAVLMAGCSAPVSMAAADEAAVRTVSTGYVPSAADAASSSGSCGGVCYGYEPQAVEPQVSQDVPVPYAGGGCVVGRPYNAQTTCTYCGICESGVCESGECGSACAAGRLAAGSLCGVARSGCAYRRAG